MTPRPFRLRAPTIAEHPLQKQMADVLRLEIGPPGRVSKHGVTWFSIDHAFYAGEAPGARVGRGIIAGVLDVVLLHAGRAYWLEVKTTAASSVLSDGQRAMIVTLIAARCQAAVVATCEQMLAALDAWLIPRAHVTNLQPSAMGVRRQPETKNPHIGTADVGA